MRRPRRRLGSSPRRTSSYACAREMPSNSPASSTVTVSLCRTMSTSDAANEPFGQVTRPSRISLSSRATDVLRTGPAGTRSVDPGTGCHPVGTTRHVAGTVGTEPGKPGPPGHGGAPAWAGHPAGRRVRPGCTVPLPGKDTRVVMGGSRSTGWRCYGCRPLSRRRRPRRRRRGQAAITIRTAAVEPSRRAEPRVERSEQHAGCHGGRRHAHLGPVEASAGARLWRDTPGHPSDQGPQAGLPAEGHAGQGHCASPGGRAGMDS